MTNNIMTEFEKPIDNARLLVSLVESRPELYNPLHINYSNRFAHAKAWKELSAKMNVPVKDFRAKWNSLRNSYARSVRSKALEPDRPRQVWYLEKHMEFLTKYIRHKSERRQYLINFGTPYNGEPETKPIQSSKTTSITPTTTKLPMKTPVKVQATKTTPPEQSPIPKSSVTKTPVTKTLVTKTPLIKTPVTITPATITPATITPATKIPATKTSTTIPIVTRNMTKSIKSSTTTENISQKTIAQRINDDFSMLDDDDLSQCSFSSTNISISMNGSQHQPQQQPQQSQQRQSNKDIKPIIIDNKVDQKIHNNTINKKKRKPFRKSMELEQLHESLMNFFDRQIIQNTQNSNDLFFQSIRKDFQKLSDSNKRKFKILALTSINQLYDESD